MARLIDRVLGLGSLTAFAVVATSCDVITGDCGEDVRAAGPQTWADGSTEDGVYRSSSWKAEDWLDFPAGVELRLEHGLGREPTNWNAFVAIDREGSLVQATGEEVELVSIDQEALVVTNPSCSDLVIVVTAD